MADKIRIGIISTARIGEKALVPAIKGASNAEVAAVSSRSLESAQAYADRNGISHAFGNYEEMLDSGEIDAVYNPLPNHLHAPLSKAAADRGDAEAKEYWEKNCGAAE